MSNLTDIICSEYDYANNRFVFISKNKDTLNITNDYHLNFYFNANKTLVSKPLSAISNFPSLNTHSFGGLCSYSTNISAVYFNFESFDSTRNTTTTQIYQLEILENQTHFFTETNIQLLNTSLLSLLYVNSSTLAYVAKTGAMQTNQTTVLGMASLYDSEQVIVKRISETGVLARGGRSSQSLYFIQSNGIDTYKLDTHQYTQSTIQIDLNMNREVDRLSIGHIFMDKNSAMEYILVYNEINGLINVIEYDPSCSNYTSLSPNNNGGFVNFYDENVFNSTNKNSNGLVVSDKTNSTNTPEARKAILSKAVNKHLDYSKRDIEAINDSRIQSSDGAYSYSAFHYVNGRDNSFPKAAMLIPAAVERQYPPYDFAFFAYNRATNEFSVTTEHIGTTTIDQTSVISHNGANSHGKLKGGVIAGIVIGIIAFIIIIFGLIVYARRQRNKQLQISRSIESPEMMHHGIPGNAPLSAQQDDIIVPFMGNSVNQHYRNYGNFSQTSSILQETVTIPEEYYDSDRPDIRPLSYSSDRVDFAQLPDEELLQLEPDVQAPLYLFSGKYMSQADEKVTYLEEGYSIRTFYANDGEKRTIHYFSAHRLDTFVRSVHAVRCVSSASTKQRKDLKEKVELQSPYIIGSERAIVLNRATPASNYQYIWITSPMMPEHSLFHLMFERTKWTFIDINNVDYKVWSIYAILKSIEAVHENNFAHLAVDLASFYVDHEMKSTDWRLGNFDFSRSLKDKLVNTRGGIKYPPHTSYTAPEIIRESKIEFIQLQKLDIWSLGCVVYTVATGGMVLFEDAMHIKNLMTFNDDMRHHLRIAIRDNVGNPAFKKLLEMMLQVYPDDRKNIKEILSYWNSTYNMNE
ncbi:MAG: hypothetical protein EXX96DRAFT_375158 [Benjaminiella poitrasii]|nr:MAG: hypothetical protein EXX96DRAFT_375158 [Benjaminiella poitrasii]